MAETNLSMAKCDLESPQYHHFKPINAESTGPAVICTPRRTRSAPGSPVNSDSPISVHRRRKNAGVLGRSISPVRRVSAAHSASASSLLELSSSLKKKADRVLMIDWDDTILCSAWISRLQLPGLCGQGEDPWKMPVGAIAAAVVKNPLLLSEESWRELEQLSQAIVDFMQMARSLLPPERIIIVTNSEAGWVQLSANAFLRSALASLSGLRIVSARTAFEKFFPGQPSSWKAAAFAYEVHELLKAEAPVKHIVSIGDGVQERHGCAIACAQFGVKGLSVRMMQLPTPRLLAHELRAVTRGLRELLETRTAWKEVACVRSQSCVGIDLVGVEEFNTLPRLPSQSKSQERKAEVRANEDIAENMTGLSINPSLKRERSAGFSGALPAHVVSPVVRTASPRMGERRKTRKTSMPAPIYKVHNGGTTAFRKRTANGMDLGSPRGRTSSPRNLPGSPLLVA